MSIDFIVRFIGMIIFCIAGVSLGISLGQMANISPDSSTFSIEQYAVIFGLVGSLFGLVLTPFITTRPLRAFRSIFTKISAQSLLASLIGLVTGLIIAALLSFPLSLLPQPFGSIMPFIGVLFFGYSGVAVFIIRQNDLLNVMQMFINRGSLPSTTENGSMFQNRNILLDTSVIIDGRIADIARTGFLPGTLIIPRFVLNELQYIADSPDSLRRQRGRRGMEVLANLQKEPVIPVRISDIDVEGAREVDDKLIILARQMHAPILTNDYNLNRIAELQGVTVLNVNELTNAVKSLMLPGENLHVRVIQEGKEFNQGVGYLDDGTMVVVEGGKDLLDKEVDVVVTKVLQTSAGRMIFARPES